MACCKLSSSSAAVAVAVAAGTKQQLTSANYKRLRSVKLGVSASDISHRVARVRQRDSQSVSRRRRSRRKRPWLTEQWPRSSQKYVLSSWRRFVHIQRLAPPVALDEAHFWISQRKQKTSNLYHAAIDIGMQYVSTVYNFERLSIIAQYQFLFRKQSTIAFSR